MVLRESYRRYISGGPRSTEKIKPLHGWVIEELQRRLGKNYLVVGLSDSNREEKSVVGRYYEKRVDVRVSRGELVLGVVSIKLVMSNYKQNKNNYFEQQLGETANLRAENIVFGHIMLLPEPIPYKNRKGEISRREHISAEDIQRYAKLVQDHGKDHVPDVQCLAVFLLEGDEILRLCEYDDLSAITPSAFNLLEKELGIENFFKVFISAVKDKYLKRKNETKPT